jgi:hypothetical protein
VLVLGDGIRETLVACVADGAGSAQHSDVGSSTACDSILHSIAAHFGANGTLANVRPDDAVQWCEVARTKLGEIATSLNCQLNDLATTLGVAIVSPTGSCFFQIGDGAIVLRKHGACGVVFWPQSGEYVNSTVFLTSKEYRGFLEFVSTRDEFSDVALLTDGIERLALQFDARIAHPRFFEPLFQALRAGDASRNLEDDLRNFLQSESVQSRSDDDKTLILASRIADENGAD